MRQNSSAKETTVISAGTQGGLLSWPNVCACCLGPAETSIEVQGRQSRTPGFLLGKSRGDVYRQYNVTTTTVVPYCKTCLKHAEQWPGRFASGIGCFGAISGIFIGLLTVLLNLSHPAYGISVGVLIAATPLLAYWFYERWAMKKSRAGMQTRCASPWPAVNPQSYASGAQISFTNGQYAAMFQEMNPGPMGFGRAKSSKDPESRITWPITVTPTNAGQVIEQVSKGLLKQVLPIYPLEAVHKRIEGTVMVDATISADGAIKETRLDTTKMLLAPNLLLADATMEAVRQWKYSPSSEETLTLITVIFKLPN